MKSRKRIIALILTVCLLVALVPANAITVFATSEDYEEMFGITYEQLYTLYPQYLSPDDEAYIMDKLIDYYISAMDSHANEGSFMQSVLDVFSKDGAMSLALDELLEGIGLKASKEEELLRDTIYLLMNNIYCNETTISSVLSKIDNGLGIFETGYDLFDAVGKDQFVKKLKKYVTTIPDNAIDSIVTQMMDDSEAITAIVGENIELCTVIQSMILLNEAQRSSLNLLKESVPANGTISKAIDIVLEDMDKDLPAYFSKHYVSEGVLRGIVFILEESLGGLAEGIYFALGLVGDIIFEELLGYATATEMNHTVILSGYVQGLYAAVLDQRKAFALAYVNKKPIGADEVADYEFIYAAYVAAVKTALEAAYNIAKTDIERGNINKAIEICDSLTYDKYMMLCLRELRGDIDSGTVAAPTTEIGYPEWCIRATYPASGTVTITKDRANIMDRPCSVNTDMNSQLLEHGALGTVYTVTASCDNIASNRWYQIITTSGQTGYIYSENCEYKPSSDVTLTGVSMPTTLTVGSRYYIQGTISTQYSTLLSVSCNVCDMSGNWKTGGTVNINAKSYVLDYSTIDALTEFNILGVGSYRCTISVIADNGSAWEEIVLYSANLTVYDPSAGTTTPDAESAEFVTRNDGVWLWPMDSEAYNKFSDWAGCNGSWSCPFPGHSGNNHGGCQAPHETADGLGHNGVDIGFYGTVYAMAAGRAYTREDAARGKYVVIEHPIGVGPDGMEWSYYTYYQHLASFSISNNTEVEAGAAIGVSGNTGVSTAIHLHVGMVLGHCNSYDAIGNLESRGWVLTSGFQEGRIVNNPARNSPAGYPTGYYVDNLYLHAGSVMYTFNKEDIVIGEGVPAECTHAYIATETLPTCNRTGYITYTCSICGDSYSENNAESWSEWTSSYPVGMSTNLIQTRTEYRHQDKEFTTSTSNALSGWTLVGPITMYGDYGAWSNWSDTPVTASDVTKVETRTVWPYYYFLCSNCGAHMHGYGTCWTWAGGCGAATHSSGWREVWSTTSWDNAGLMDWYGTGKYYTYINGELVFKLVEAGPKTQYRYCTRESIDGYEFYRWGDWSEWSDTPYSANDDRNVEMRTAYRYYTGPLAEHTWGEGVVTKAPTATEVGECRYACLVCDAVKTEMIPALGVSFNDVTSGSFYYEPVMWAVENGITNGTTPTTFSPNDQCMRAHVVTFLWRAMGSPEPKLMVNPFVDVKPSDFYYKPVLWALENGITSGMDATHFGPTTYCNRAQVVTFLYRTMGSPALEAAENPFTDVAEGSFYEKPVLWAVQNGITNGLSTTTFGPSVVCNRAQIVTFLYRACN